MMPKRLGDYLDFPLFSGRWRQPCGEALSLWNNTSFSLLQQRVKLPHQGPSHALVFTVHSQSVITQRELLTTWEQTDNTVAGDSWRLTEILIRKTAKQTGSDLMLQLLLMLSEYFINHRRKLCCFICQSHTNHFYCFASYLCSFNPSTSRWSLTLKCHTTDNCFNTSHLVSFINKH